MITNEQIDYIAAEIDKSDVKDASLRDDLLDHMCCLIEIEMKRGASFEDAYQKAYDQTSPNGFGEIQNETTFLLNYNKIVMMKLFTYISGFVFTLSFIAGAFFKLLHWPGAYEAMLIGTFGFVLIFMPLLLINRFKQATRGILSEKLKWIFGVLSVFLFVTASYFKISHLAGANILLGLSFIVFSLGYLPFLFFRMYKKSVETV